MTELGGYMGKVMKIDLSNQEITEYPWTDEDRRLYLGGKIMAAKIIVDLVPPTVQAFDEENIIVISTGPLTNTQAPSSSRFNISTISPLTNLLTSSNCGGNFGMMLKRAGYDALILSGKAESKTWIEITENEVLFHSACELWGLSTSQTQEQLTTLTNKSGKVVIGPAGEHLVKYAGVFSQERAAGRGGVGAVFGSKNIKAITAIGTILPKVKQAKPYKNFIKKWIKVLKNHPLTGELLPKFGTAGILMRMNEKNVLATRNFKYGQFDEAQKISGEELAQTKLVKNKGCITCPIQCGRVVLYKGKPIKGPELETLGVLGSNLENADLDQIIEWNYLADELGMDTISLGGSIAYAMEMNEDGLWDNKLHFGSTTGISQLIEDIAYRRGIGDELAEGVKKLSTKYGRKDIAIHAKGMELSAYEPRSSVGMGLGYAVSNRGGCHLNGGYPILVENIALSVKPYQRKGKAELTAFLQNIMEATSASGNCLFTLYPMLPGFALRNSIGNKVVSGVFGSYFTKNLLNFINKAKEGYLHLHLGFMLPHTKALKLVTGMNITIGRLKTIGERGYTLERVYNSSRGISSKDDVLPERLTTQKLKDVKESFVPLEDMKQKYYKTRGWNKEGLPSDKTLKRLKLK